MTVQVQEQREERTYLEGADWTVEGGQLTVRSSDGGQLATYAVNAWASVRFATDADA